MKHRERVLTALNRQAPDRCPFYSSFTPEFAARLRADQKLATQPFYNPHGGGNAYDLEQALGIDMLLTSVGWANGYYVSGYSDLESYTDEWGLTWKVVEYSTRFGKGHYTEPFGPPLVDEAAVANYAPPNPHRPELYDEAARVIRDFKDEYWIVGVTVTTIFESAWALRGLEQLMMDFVTDPDLANTILDFTYCYHLEAAKKLVELGVDMIWTGDDVGSQGQMLISPQLWRRFFKPRMANFFATLKRINPALKTAYHSDGYIGPIIPDLIEIGLDILNPVQPAVMDPAELKRDYGDKLCFWGSMDIQHTLPHGSPQDVEAEVRRRLQTIGRDGGLILAPTHNVQLDVPLENYYALVNTITQTPYRSLH